MSEESSSRRGLFRGLAAAAARAAIPDPKPEPAPARAPLLSDSELERYSRQLVLPEWTEMAQLALRDASVLVIGAGALGSPVALYLAGAGIGRLGIADDDAVELSNLHRQLLHFTPDIGVPKVESAATKLRFLNPEIVVEPYHVRVDAVSAPGLVEGQDLVIDCSDSFATRYAVNAACCEAGIDLVEGGVMGWSGLVMTIVPAPHRLLPLRVPDRAGGHAVVRRGRRARPGGGRDRLDPGARSAEVPDRRRRRRSSTPSCPSTSPRTRPPRST